MKKKGSIREYVMCALCTALICVLAPVSLPIGPIPVSLATFAVLFAGFLLGPRWGAVSAAVYLAIGMIGVPVFSGYTGGFAKLAGPTGGYLLGYIPMAAISGLFYHKIGKKLIGFKKYLTMAGGALIGTAVLYALGTAWFCVESGNSVGAALSICVIPFLPGDTIKTIAAMITVPAVETALSKAQLSLSSVQ
jgi:biotin transport system substrate-specific component